MVQCWNLKLLAIETTLLIYKKYSLGQSIIAYRDLHHRLSDTNAQICQFLEHQPIQSQNSELCGLFCIYIAHIIFSKREIVKINDVQLLRFALHMMF